jgi:chromosome segregation ATPase
LESERDEMTTDLQSRDKQIVQVKTELRNSTRVVEQCATEKSELEHRIIECRSANTTLQQRVERLQEKTRRARDTNMRHIADLQQADDLLTAKNSRIAELETEIARLRAEIEHWQKAHAEDAEQCEKLTAQLQEVTSTLLQARAEKQQILDDLHDVKQRGDSTNAELRFQVAGFERERAAWDASSEAKDAELAELRREKAAFLQQINAITRELAVIQPRFAEALAEKSRSMAALEVECAGQKEWFQREMSAAQSTIESLRKMITRLEKRIE